MARDYFKECKAIIESILENLKKNDQFDDDLYYTIDILDVDGDKAKVMVCDSYMYLAKEQGNWTEVPAPETAKQTA